MAAPAHPYSQQLLQRRTQQSSVLLTPDIYDWYRRMQASHRLYHDESRASWLVFHYEDVQQVTRDSHTFSSERTINPDGSIDPIASSGIVGMDPPRHRPLRALIAQAFTARRVAQLEPRIHAIVHALLDTVQDAGRMDLIDDFAFPLPVIVIAELLGVPIEDRERFRRWSSDFVGANYGARRITVKEIAAYFSVLIERRRREPREDLISELLRAEVEGSRLSEPDIVGTCLLLLVAGHETTTALIGSAVICFDDHPEALNELMAEPDLLPGAIEEVLRYRAVVHTMPRVVKLNTSFLGQEMRAGELVLPLFASANLDERQFPNADRFDIHRAANRHLGLGYGIHLCLGGALGRLETRIALSALLERFPQLRRDRSIPLELRPSPFIYGMTHIPLTLRA